MPTKRAGRTSCPRFRSARKNKLAACVLGDRVSADQDITRVNRLKKILIMGLPGAGKTTLATALKARLNAVLFNADEIRQNINRDLGFSLEDRIEHARRMGWLCDQVTTTGAYAIADFICPTPETRAAFLAGGDAFIVWVDRIEAGRFSDTNQIFVPPDHCDVRVTPSGTAEYWAERVAERVRPVFDPRKPTALFIGRFQPFHGGHLALVREGLHRVGQACVAVRNTGGLDDSNPFDFEQVRARIEHALRMYEGRFIITPLPNITHVFYGRDVGYVVERIELDAKIESISATKIRDLMKSRHGT
ncbi:adenylyl-sulfate kinase [Reyranella sp. CPCC 100927]|nr:adenylyl-sulfate kinase [Reyranella sp. CPCC 100927]